MTKSGILRDKTIDDKLIYIPNDDKQNHPSVDQNYWIILYTFSQMINYTI